MKIVRINSPSEIRDPRLRDRAEKACAGNERQFLARVDDREAGYLSYDDLEVMNTGVIYDMLVLPEFRNRGVGSTLILAAEELATELGRYRVRGSPVAFDETVDQKWLEAWYRKKGYGDCDCEEELEKVLNPDGPAVRRLRTSPVAMNAQQISNEDRARITLVADALRRKAPQSDITASLIQSGLSASEASDFCSTVTHGLRAGVTAGVTGDASAVQYSGSEPAIWQAAFAEGRSQFSGAVRGAWFQRFWWLLIPLVALLIWLFSR